MSTGCWLICPAAGPGGGEDHLQRRDGRARPRQRMCLIQLRLRVMGGIVAGMLGCVAFVSFSRTDSFFEVESNVMLCFRT